MGLCSREAGVVRRGSIAWALPWPGQRRVPWSRPLTGTHCDTLSCHSLAFAKPDHLGHSRAASPYPTPLVSHCLRPDCPPGRGWGWRTLLPRVWHRTCPAGSQRVLDGCVHELTP